MSELRPREKPWRPLDVRRARESASALARLSYGFRLIELGAGGFSLGFCWQRPSARPSSR